MEYTVETYIVADDAIIIVRGWMGYAHLRGWIRM